MGDHPAWLDQLFIRDEDEDGFADQSRRRSRRPDDGHEIPNVVVVHVTDNALLVRGRGLSTDPFGLEDPNEEAWVPRSQVHQRSEIAYDSQGGEEGTLVITTWLAEKKGLC